jgi:hypothetical protein
MEVCCFKQFSVHTHANFTQFCFPVRGWYFIFYLVQCSSAWNVAKLQSSNMPTSWFHARCAVDPLFILWRVAQSFKTWNQKIPCNALQQQNFSFLVAKVSIITTTKELLKARFLGKAYRNGQFHRRRKKRILQDVISIRFDQNLHLGENWPKEDGIRQKNREG